MAAVHQILSQARSLSLAELTLCQFLCQSVSWKTIQMYLSALQIRAGLPDPSLSFSPRLTYVLKGIRRIIPEYLHKHRLPITINLLIALHSPVWSTPPVQYNHVMLWAACCLSFYVFLHPGEFTCPAAEPPPPPPLSPSDIAVDS